MLNPISIELSLPIVRAISYIAIAPNEGIDATELRLA